MSNCVYNCYWCNAVFDEKDELKKWWIVQSRERGLIEDEREQKLRFIKDAFTYHFNKNTNMDEEYYENEYKYVVMPRLDDLFFYHLYHTPDLSFLDDSD